MLLSVVANLHLISAMLILRYQKTQYLNDFDVIKIETSIWIWRRNESKKYDMMDSMCFMMNLEILNCIMI